MIRSMRRRRASEHQDRKPLASGPYSARLELVEEAIVWEWFKKRRDRGALNPAELGSPWGDRPSIYEHVERTIGPKAAGTLKHTGPDLPDEPAEPEGGIRFAAGARDGVFGHHVGGGSAADVARTAHGLLVRVVTKRAAKDFNVLYAYLVEHSTLEYVDELNEAIVRGSRPDVASYAALARHLLRRAADREVVKFAIDLIGVFGGPEDHESLLTIGAHDEFTLFAVVALGNTGGGETAVWEMAKRAAGWGRVQCIERLDHEIENEELKRWLLREGYKNDVMTEYTASVCAMRGGLLAALSDDHPDGELIDGAAEILAALARGGPREAMAGYPDGYGAAMRFLEVVEDARSPKVSWLLAACDLERFGRAEPNDGAEPEGWTPALRAKCADAAHRLVQMERWRAVVERDLRSADDQVFGRAAAAAKAIGIDPWEHEFGRLLAGKDMWYWVLQTRNESRFARVMAHAETAINLDRVATGYGDALGIGPGFEEHRKLDWVLQELRRWPGWGERYIVAGLQSPVVRNRLGAVRAALRWEPAARGKLVEAAKALHGMEQREVLKAALGRLVVGEVDPVEGEGPE